MTRAEFERGIARLGILRGMPEDVSPFWDLFQTVPVTDWQAGIEHAIKSRTFFPVPAELFEDCEVARPVRSWVSRRTEQPARDGYLRTERIECPLWPAAVTVKVYREWFYDCTRCQDDGWISHWCGGPPPKPWQLRTTCNRSDEHGQHEWVEPCHCVATNPTVQRRRDALSRAAIARSGHR